MEGPEIRSLTLTAIPFLLANSKPAGEMSKNTSSSSFRSIATDLPVYTNYPIYAMIALKSYPVRFASTCAISPTLLTVKSFLKTFLPLRSKPALP
jgi:hypothetical protein